MVIAIIGGDTHTAGAAIAAPSQMLGQQPMQNAAPSLQNNMYNLGNWSLMIASISGQMALACSLSNHFGPHLPLLFKLH